MSPLNSALVVELSDDGADDAQITGAKAAALAQAASAGLPVLPGIVLTTIFAATVDSGATLVEHPAVQEAFVRAGGASRSLVARSSSTVEDQAGSSMAGQFESVIGINGLDEFVAAVGRVLDSRATAGAPDTPIAVLVQPLIEPAAGGVMFGIDPVSGRSDHRVVSAVVGGPEPLVSGEVEGSRYVLTAAGREVESDQRDGVAISRRVLRKLVTLSDEVESVFGGPQDVEWALTDEGALRLLQSRAVTTAVRGVPDGPVYGPGPVAETFPEPLNRLETDLWLPPLRTAVREAVRLAGVATEADLARTESVVSINGIVAIDLLLTGEAAPRRSMLRRLNPVRSARQLRGAWRVGRLRSALPSLAEDLLDRVDTDLEAAPAIEQLTSRQIIALLGRGQGVLVALHAHEMLMGLLTDSGDSRMTGASVALRILSEARRDGLTDDEIIARSPVVLALTPPCICSRRTLPPDAVTPDLGAVGESENNNGILREALRLRARWLQELTGSAAWALGERLASAGEIPSAGSIRHLSLADIEAIATKRAVTRPHLLDRHDHDYGEPLPACFQISELGRPIMVRREGEIGGGTGAGGGVGHGPVTHDAMDPPVGSVLVTTTLTPGLGPLLPRLAGVVAETGSVLSHLAILARESRVPIVVGFVGAASALEEGVIVTVDGDAGDVTIDEEDRDPEDGTEGPS